MARLCAGRSIRWKNTSMDAPTSTPLDVVLVEDSAVLRDLLSAMLEGMAVIHIVGTADSEADALALIRRTRPRLVIVDLELRQGSGLGLLAALQSQAEFYGNPHAVVFSNHAHAVVQSKCKALGALAFFDKSFQMDDLLTFIDDEAGRRLHEPA